jgi:tetrapyrrole methylase family protein/MazG family protein
MSTKSKKSVSGGQRKKSESMGRLRAIMAKLRGPGGCPWDRVQTENTLKKYLLEEAYEAVEAIESGGPEELKEELGDVLLQIVFLSRIAEEKGEFDLLDVAQTLAEKLIRRHPHVFPAKEIVPAKPKDAQGVVKIWGKVKEMEGKYAKRKSLLDGLPLALPALERARRLSERAARVGFDWPDIRAVWEKVQEETAELKAALDDPSPEAAEHELGDLLFALVNWGRFQGISAEEALRKANRRFIQRFRFIESALQSQGRKPQEASLEEMDELWNKAKRTYANRRGRRERKR